MLLKKYAEGMDYDFLNLLALDLDGNLRGVSMPRAYITDRFFRNGIGFDASNYGYAKVTDSDMIIVPDRGTAFLEERDGYRILQMIGDVYLSDGRPFDQYARNVVRRTEEYLREKGLADNAMVLPELEYYVFDSVRYGSSPTESFYSVASSEGLGSPADTEVRFGPHAGYHRIPPEDRYMEFRNRTVHLMGEIGIPVKYHHHEVAAAQLEIELDFANLLQGADNVCLAKWIVRAVAEEMGLKVTFMPKPLYRMPGNGMHVHQFLEKDGVSTFLGEELYGLSSEALSYIAGLLEHSLTGSLLAFANPSTNSFKRLTPGYEAPISATFAKSSRNAAVRIPGYLRKDEVRMEYRTGDATANTHYMFAAMILAGCDGILRGADPVALGFNNPDVDEDRMFPLNLRDVLAGLKKDCEYLSPAFPQALIDLWIAKKDKEADYIAYAPVPQEYELYF